MFIQIRKRFINKLEFIKSLPENNKLQKLVKNFKSKPRWVRLVPTLLAAALILHILFPLLQGQKAFAINGNSNLNGYIWENDDGTDADGNSQLAAGNTSVNVPKGSRLNLRAQIKNTGTSMDLSKLGLFYDKGDGTWSKVKSGEKANNVGDGITNYYTTIDSSSAIEGRYTSIVIDNSGTKWVSYQDATNADLKVAKYVGSGGNCTDTAWNCSTVDSIAITTGLYTSIAIDASGNPWVSYYDSTNSALRVAKYVGSGGNCTDTAWNCSAVDNTGTITGQYTSVAFSPAGTAWVSYYDSTNSALRVAKYVGSGGNCTDTAWNCSAVDNTGTITGEYTSIAIDSAGTPWVSYYDATNSALRVAKFVTSGGNCTDTAWNCSVVDNTGTSTGTYTSIAIDSTGTPWVSFYDTTNSALRVAKFVTSGGNCTDTAWNCSAVDNTASDGVDNKIVFDKSDTPWVSYRDVSNQSIRVAKFVTSGGNCTDTAWNCAGVTGNSSNYGVNGSMAIDQSGDPWISYNDLDGGTLGISKVSTFKMQYRVNSGCYFPDIITCTTIDNTGTSTGQYSSIAIDPSGKPWVSYVDSTNTSLRVANFVGSGGNCTDTAWNCSAVDNTGTSTGTYTSIAIDASGTPWVSYLDVTNTALRIAKFVGSGGNCTDTAWNCSAVDNTGTSTGTYTSIAIDASGTPWVSYLDVTNTALRIAKFVGSGGNCTDTAWNCSAVDNTGTSTGQYTSIAIDASGTPWVSYTDTTNTSLRVAKFVTSGGNCTDTAWNCSAVDNTGTSTGTNTSIAFDPSGNPWVSYSDVTAGDLRVAKFVTSGGNCTDTAWNCSVVDANVGTVGTDTNIAFDPSGKPWVTYRDIGISAERLAVYVGSGGNCNDTAWDCSVLDNSGSDGSSQSGIAFDPSGTPWVTYNDFTATSLRLATISRRGEIVLGASQRYSSGTLLESHVDMTTTVDTTNRDDADCVGGGTWNNGVLFTSEQGSGTLADGTGTAQCTEVMFSIDFAQATVGSTYRFMISSYEPITSGRNFWRGPISIASGATPTVTISDASYRFAKNNNYSLPNCADTAWGCDVIHSTNDVGSFSGPSSFGFDPSGNPWMSYYDATGGDLIVAKYVGASGTGCASSAWTCTTVESTNDVGKYSSITFDSSGNPWVSYYEAASTSCNDSPTTECSLHVAHYVGSSGTGCATAAWTCTIIDNPTTTGDLGQYTSVAIDASNKPWISYYDAAGGNIRVATYMGGGTTGTGCTSNSWTCVAVETTNDIGKYSSIAFSASGNAWVSYYDATGGNLRVAQYMGTGGTGCAIVSWNCTAVETTNDVGQYSSIAFDSLDQPWVSYYEAASTSCNDTPTSECSLHVAQYVGASGTGCATATWTCSIVDNPTSTGDYGQYSSIAFDSAGKAWVSYYDAVGGNLRVTNFVTSGGSGCTSGAWSCTAVDTTNDVGKYSTIAYGSSGTPWVMYYDTTGGNVRVAKLHRPSTILSEQSNYRYNGRNATNADARYRLTLGKTAAANEGACGGGIADYYGICSLFQNSGNYDTITAQINESPYLTFAMRYDTNSELPTAVWVGQSTLAPNTAGTAGDLVLQAYHGGSTNAWETIASDTASSNCSSDNCKLTGIPSGTASEYFTVDSLGKYWVSFRLYQGVSTSSTITLKTDQFKAAQPNTLIGTGSFFLDEVKRPLNYR